MGSERSFGRRTAVLAVAAVLILGICGCVTTSTPTETASSPIKEHVKVVVVTFNASGQPTFDPDKITIRRGINVIVWVSDQGSLNISFPENPFAEVVRCPGDRFCASLLPANRLGTFAYSGTVRVGEVIGSADPQVEVIP